MSAFWDVTLGGMIGSGIATSIIGALLMRRNARISEEMKAEFAKQLNRSSSQRGYQEKALEQLFGPAKMQLSRTRRAFGRWTKRNDHIETKIIREGNLFLRDLFLAKGHLLPPHLFKDAEQLVEHFDAWLEEYDRVRGTKDNGQDFVFVGPKGFPFPKESEQRIIAYSEILQQELYGEIMRAN